MLTALCHADAYGLGNVAPLYCKLRDLHVSFDLRARIQENATRYLLDWSNGDRVVVIATRYNLEDSWFEPLSVREIFFHTRPDPPNLPYKEYRAS